MKYLLLLFVLLLPSLVHARTACELFHRHDWHNDQRFQPLEIFRAESPVTITAVGCFRMTETGGHRGRITELAMDVRKLPGRTVVLAELACQPKPTTRAGVVMHPVNVPLDRGQGVVLTKTRFTRTARVEGTIIGCVEVERRRRR
jgi:hypothetical protein